MINVAILGYGTVGSGVYRVITDNNDVVKKSIGEDIRGFDKEALQEVLAELRTLGKQKAR